jgi:hypothetical protein
VCPGFPPGEQGHLAVAVDHRDLAVLTPAIGTEHPVQRSGRRQLAMLQGIENLRPSAGRVMFWVETAPTPARTQGQRAPTAMLDELMAIPTWPVSWQRPMMENVMSWFLLCCAIHGILSGTFWQGETTFSEG